MEKRSEEVAVLSGKGVEAAAVLSCSETRVAVVGASDYTGEELVGLLFVHPQVDLVATTSRQFSGKTLAQVFRRFSHHGKALAAASAELGDQGFCTTACLCSES